ncbi:ABC transporter ATP-binding protein [Entomoplasma ellychniae]|uniref:ABC transporter ATP-binding protein n=2 Tax=Entomoplasmataceae TaxID=33925 RepID=A0A2S5RGZ0_9MOLU|nr:MULTISPECIES: ABC transporter ATP-binding protein [Entomoplasmataceae]PPE04900.1 ABC transporter ATP-binding protein [Entomoplasma ellychniae]PPE06561.1 ABC transporter ATP-binding protein [Mesoplasma corruscae]
MKKYKVILSFVIFLAFCEGFLMVISSYSTSFIGNSLEKETPFVQIIIILSIIVALTLIYYFFTMMNGYFQQRLWKRLIFNYKMRINHYLVNNSTELLRTDKVQDFEAVFLNDAEIIRENRYAIAINFFSLSIEMITAIGIIIYNILTKKDFIYLWVVLIVVVISLLIFLNYNFWNKKLRKNQENFSQNNHLYNKNLNSILHGYQIIFGNNLINLFKDKMNKVNTDYETKDFTNQYQKNILNTLLKLGNYFSTILITIITIYLWIKNIITLGESIAISSLSINLINSIVSFLQNLAVFNSTKNIFNKYNDKNHNLEFNFESEQVQTIEFENVQIKYGDKVVIKNFNQKFELNQKYLLSGPSGTGKSTLVKSLIQLTQISEGNIKINGKTIDDKNLPNLKNQIAYIDQNTYLFDDSVAFNIALDEEYDVNKINQILDLIKLPQLKITAKNDQINLGGENDKLSGGEKQRIGLARALYTDKPIWIIDENTSNLDKLNKEIIEKIILTQRNKMIIMISHDLLKENYQYLDHEIKLNTN